MKKILLIGVNAKYIHTNLAIRYLKKYAEKMHTEETDIKIESVEFSINDRVDPILRNIVKHQPDLAAFSCYIWNMELILKLCSCLKQVSSKTLIALGGPEVSYDAADLLEKHPYIDLIISGEGEMTFAALAAAFNANTPEFKSTPGIIYRDGNIIVDNGISPVVSVLDDIPFPYEGEVHPDDKILYYETSRGCPFRCQYCLSSTTHGVRHFSLERIKQDIDYFINQKVRQVKLVDRTFNCNRKLANAIMEYILERKGETNFHFEIAADLIDEDFIELVKRAPRGLFQFEIGVQSTHMPTLEAIQRVMDFDKVSRNVEKLLALGNCHLHLDLIAGLPYESFERFKQSFNQVYALKPHMLQLGFLKLLKGSGLRHDMSLYGIRHQPFPPYEVLSTQWLDFKDLLDLKDVEQLLETFYNSGIFSNTLTQLFSELQTAPFDFYYAFAQKWRVLGYFDAPKGLSDLFRILFDHIEELGRMNLRFNELLKLDWLLHNKNASPPAFIRRYDLAPLKDRIYNYIKNDPQLQEYMKKENLQSVKEFLKHTRHEVFFIDLKNTFSVQDTLVLFLPENHGKTIQIYSVPLDVLI